MASSFSTGAETKPSKRPGWSSPFASSGMLDDRAVADVVRGAAIPLHWSDHDYDELLMAIGDAEIVLIGEASHGTHEFYRERARITKRLILEKGFTAVTWEADWPDAYDVNRYVKGLAPLQHDEPYDSDAEQDQRPRRRARRQREDAAAQQGGAGAPDEDGGGGGVSAVGFDAIDALRGFKKRFPTWMWRNADVLDFVGWLREHNDRIAGSNQPGDEAGDELRGTDLATADANALGKQAKVGVYGLDLYSMYQSIADVLTFLRRTNNDLAKRGEQYYACFAGYHGDSQEYGYSTGMGLARSCEADATAVLLDMQKRRTARFARLAAEGGMMRSVVRNWPRDPSAMSAAAAASAAAAQEESFEEASAAESEAQIRTKVAGDEDAHFAAEQNALLVVDAEQYYREMFRGRASSWNLRDGHMLKTLTALRAYLTAKSRGSQAAGVGGRQLGPDQPVKIVVWAHNSHLGDASATDMSAIGEVNLGQLCRQAFGKSAVFSVGFSSFRGTVTAASDWDAPAERKHVRPGAEGSYEMLFHRVGIPRFMVLLDAKSTSRADHADEQGVRQARQEAVKVLQHRRLQRAIGVVYKPQTERVSHYVNACLPLQFDAMIHIDETRAVEPLERTAVWHRGEVPETYPEGL